MGLGLSDLSRSSSVPFFSILVIMLLLCLVLGKDLLSSRICILYNMNIWLSEVPIFICNNILQTSKPSYPMDVCILVLMICKLR